jgi:hypothetical protein
MGDLRDNEVMEKSGIIRVNGVREKEVRLDITALLRQNEMLLEEINVLDRALVILANGYRMGIDEIADAIERAREEMLS